MSLSVICGECRGPLVVYSGGMVSQHDHAGEREAVVRVAARTAVLADLSAEMSRVTVILMDGQEAVLMSDLHAAIHRRIVERES